MISIRKTADALRADVTAHAETITHVLLFAIGLALGVVLTLIAGPR